MSEIIYDPQVEELAALLDRPKGDISNSVAIASYYTTKGQSEVARQQSTGVWQETKQDLVADIGLNLLPRLESAGGRPSVADWTVGRLTTYAATTWEQLQEVANAASTKDRKVSPAQVASYIVESALGQRD